jgi:hypothetical protein
MSQWLGLCGSWKLMWLPVAMRAMVCSVRWSVDGGGGGDRCGGLCVAWLMVDG